MSGTERNDPQYSDQKRADEKTVQRLRHSGEITQAARQAMQQREQGLDGETLSRLRRARHAALESANARPSFSLWMPLGAASAAVLALALWIPGQWSSQPLSSQQISSQQAALVQDDLLADTWLLDDEVELEMIEDVEFYQWLAEEALDARSS